MLFYWIQALKAIGLGLVTAVLCHLSAFGVVEGGTHYIWGKEAAQRHLHLLWFTWPALLSVGITACSAVALRLGGIAGVWIVTFIAVATLILTFGVPGVLLSINEKLADNERLADGLLAWYMAALTIAASWMWLEILRRARYAAAS